MAGERRRASHHIAAAIMVCGLSAAAGWASAEGVHERL
jgi:hypothetical protein